jgi:hypothetical protein
LAREASITAACLLLRFQVAAKRLDSHAGQMLCSGFRYHAFQSLPDQHRFPDFREADACRAGAALGQDLDEPLSRQTRESLGNRKPGHPKCRADGALINELARGEI